ncbi:hypothetical protein COV16_05570 [Candidatus Woesearchaeota archaeon CG10_big_fil_rev_8_21_14_0_10_34_8]|nr:MAG: hypothetical protein COV16_05570 [Candidatus Woesearchaeota archaeon CG10_big_fil_rev_8_21_14_0_10_34_8]
MSKPYSIEQKVFGILSYFPVLVLIPLLVKKDDDFVHFHAKQGLILFICWIFIAVLSYIPLFGGLLALLLTIGLLVLMVIAIIQVIKCKKWEIPVLYVYADRLNF